MQLLHLLVFGLVSVVLGYDLDVSDNDLICAAAKIAIDGEWNYYEGIKYGGTVGMFTNPYYWWHAGEAFGGILNYYIFCDSDNDTLKEYIYDAMYHQAGDDFNYIPSNQSMTEGNDDQGVWGLTVMEAFERNFTDPEDHSWLEMGQAIYNTMYARWDDDHCGGGLRWQIFTWNSGYNYKNSIANGCLFHIAARLARYLDNDTYADVAEQVWDWMVEVGFIVHDGNEMIIYDGANVEENCTDLSTQKWSYTYGIFLSGCAYLYNYTEESKWLERVQEILAASSYFFEDDIMQETTCQPSSRCNNDQRSFRSLFSRGLGLTSVLVPEVYDDIRPLLETSAVAAASTCDGGDDGVTCGQDWAKGTYDENYGLGEQMSVAECILSLLQPYNKIYSNSTGGTSKANYDAGLDTTDTTNNNELTITLKDKAGAGVLTAVVLAILLGGAVWMLF